MSRTTALIAFLLLLLPSASWSRSRQETPEQVAQEATQQIKTFDLPVIEQELKLADFAGMAPRADLREKLAHVTGFLQFKPADGSPASEETEVWMARSSSTIYFAILCHDSQVNVLNGHLVRRENLLNEDRVAILLDPFLDHRKGLIFEVNPLGVQADGIWNDHGSPDYSYDQVWDSEAAVTENGWMALVAIPFRSLRFPHSGASWGIAFQRQLLRQSEVSFWPWVTPNIAGVLTQEGTMNGMSGITGSSNFQINPYFLSQNLRNLNNFDNQTPYFTRRNLASTGGGEIKAILKDSLVFDATINPDFSTVESDQPQFTANQRYKVFFPELRPFFLENSNYFITPTMMIYTRNILHPEFGARLTGKINRTNLGFLTIDDRQPGEVVAKTDPRYLKRALYAVARVTQDFGSNSFFGGFYTSQEFAGGWNRIGGLDFNARLNQRWSLAAMAAVSSTQDNPYEDDPKYSAGPAYYVTLRRSSRAFHLNSTYKDFAKGFKSLAGFIPTTDEREIHTLATYTWYPKDRLVNSYGFESNQFYAWDHESNRLYHKVSLAPFVSLPRNLKLYLLAGQNSDTLGPDDDETLTTHKSFTENYGGFQASGNPWSFLSFNLKGIRGGNVNFNPAAGKTTTLLRQQSINAQLILQPINPLSIDNTYLLDRNFSLRTNAFAYEAQTLRTKLNYQFTRALSARVIVEYASTLRNEMESSLERKKKLTTQALFTWMPYPGTAIYAGYNNGLNNVDRSYCYRNGSGVCDADADTLPRSDNWLNNARQFFVKFSYLYRF